MYGVFQFKYAFVCATDCARVRLVHPHLCRVLRVRGGRATRLASAVLRYICPAFGLWRCPNLCDVCCCRNPDQAPRARKRKARSRQSGELGQWGSCVGRDGFVLAAEACVSCLRGAALGLLEGAVGDVVWRGRGRGDGRASMLRHLSQSSGLAARCVQRFLVIAVCRQYLRLTWPGDRSRGCVLRRGRLAGEVQWVARAFTAMVCE